jgi:hypothetical protein
MEGTHRMKYLVKFSQPSDYRFRGREVWINPDEVLEMVRSEDTPCATIIRTRTGAFTVQGEPRDIAAQIQEAL